jgi:hypothetical protein
MRNELTTPSSLTYAYSVDGINWSNGALPSSLTTTNPYSTKWLGDKYFISGNLVSRAYDMCGNTVNSSCLIHFNDASKNAIIELPSGDIIYDIEKNLEYNHTITFPKSTILAVGGTPTDTIKIAYSYNQGNTWISSYNSASVFTSTVYGSAWNGRIWVAVGSGGNTIGTSLDGNIWTGRGSSVISTQANGVDWSDQLGIFVAVGSGTNTIATSYDGVYWNGCGNTVFSMGNDVKWNGSMWVAVGTPIDANNKSIAYSYDGVHWSVPSQSTLFNTSGIQVSWNGQKWTAIGSDTGGNSIATSVDGILWTMINDASLSYPVKTLYTDINNTIICTSSSTISGSVPPVSNWNFSAYNNYTGSIFYVSANYNGSIVLKTGTTTQISYNSGASYSTISPLGGNSYNNGICQMNYYGNVMIISGASYNSQYNFYYAYSTDYGSNWSVSNIQGSNALGGIYGFALSKNGNIIYAISLYNGVFYSSNSGASFSAIPFSNFGNSIPCYASVNAQGNIAYISAANGLYKSVKDASNNFTYTKLLNINNTYGPICSQTDSTGNIVYAINNTGTAINIYKSTDAGSTWTSFSSGIVVDIPFYIGTDASCLIFNTQLPSNANSLCVSLDGTNTFTQISNSKLTGFSYGCAVAISLDFSKVFVSYNSNQLYLYSLYNTQIYTVTNDDYLSKKIYNNLMNVCLSVTNDGTQYMIGGSSVLESFDLKSYTSTLFNNLSLVYRLTPNKANKGRATIKPLTIACGEGNTSLAYSYDGIQWIAINNTIFTRSNKAAWNGKLWIAVGTGAYWAAFSYDGIQWTGSDSSLLSEGYDVAWNGSVFVAVGTGSNNIATSSDGINWNRANYSVFTSSANSIHWTGSTWLAYGSGSNTTAISSDGSTWAATSSPNLAVTDSTNVLQLGAYTASASSTLSGYPASNAFDGSFNTNITVWQSAAANYIVNTGVYQGSTSTTYNTSSTANGEWIQVALSSSVVINYYYMVFSVASGTAIPYSWILLGSNNGSTWSSIDTFSYGTAITSYPNNNWKYPFVALPLNVSSNTTAYQYYRVVFTQSFGSTSVSVADIQLFQANASTNTLNIRLKPIVLKDCILHPTQLLSVDGSNLTIYQLSNLSCTPIRNGYIHRSFVNNVVYGTGSSLVTGSSFDGYNHLITSKGGAISYISNDSSISNLNIDISYNSATIQSNLSSVYASCYNTNFFILGGSGSSVISYNVLNTGSTGSWYSTNASNLFTTVYGLASNSGYGMVVPPNALYFNKNEKLSLVTPKTYNSYIEPETSISFTMKSLP